MFLAKERTKIFIIYTIFIGILYAQVVFFSKTLIPNLYYPKHLTPPDYERRPVNTFKIDLATPAFYEMPINRLVGDMYLKGQLPLWNPYQGAGTPLAAQYSTRAFFPYQILEDISPYWLWDYFMLGRLIIAAFFTYLFLRLLNVSSPCAFLGGIFYSLSGSFTWFINSEQFTNVAMMVPICLFSLERYIQLKKRRYIAESAIVLALMLLAGQPEIAIYVMLLVFFYYFFRVVIEKPKILIFLKSTLRFIGIIFLALCLSAFLIIPFLELIPHSYHCHPLGGRMGTLSPAKLGFAVAILIPPFFELPTYYRFFPHNGTWDWLGGYTGLLMPFLIALGFFYKGKYRKFFLFFLLFGFAIILKNFGFPLMSWIGKLPLLDQSWSPRWAGPVWTFSLACAAAIGLEMITQAVHKKRALPLGIFCFLFIVTYYLCVEAYSFLQIEKLNSEYLVKFIFPNMLGGAAVALCIISISTFLFICCEDKRNLLYSIIFLAIFELWFYIPKGSCFPWTVYKLLPFFLGLFVIFQLLREKWRLSIIGIILIILSFTFIDVKSPYGFSDRHNLFEEPDYVKFLKKDKDYQRVVAGGGLLMPNFSSSFKIYDVRYINSLSPLSYQNYVDYHLLKEPHSAISDRLWFTGIADFNKLERRSIYQEICDNFLYYSYLGVKYIITKKDITFDLPLVYDRDIKIYKNPSAFPRAYIARNFKMASSFQEAQDLMKIKEIDLKDTVLLEREPPSWYKPITSSNSEAKIEKYTPNMIKISAKTESDGILVLTDVYYPGWKVYVDNEEGQLYRVNGLVRGVFLNKGEHDIIFTYSPFSYKLGLIISAIALIICLAFIFI